MAADTFGQTSPTPLSCRARSCSPIGIAAGGYGPLRSLSSVWNPADHVHVMSVHSDNTPRLRLRRTRRGWMVAALAVTVAGAGLGAGGLAAAQDTGTTCATGTTTTSTTETSTTTTTASTATCTDPTTNTGTTTGTGTTTSTGEQPAPDPAPASEPSVQATSEWQPSSPSGAGSESGSQPAPENQPATDSTGAQTPAQAPDAGAKTGSAGATTHGDAGSGPHRRPSSGQHATSGAPHRGGLKAGRKAHTRSRSAGGPSDQVYFPPVSIDWAALTPLAPPPFPGTAASTFPGPYFLLPIYQAAAVQYGVPWQVLASINQVETGWGQNMGPSSAGAIGWMQFLPSTWKTYGVDANGDGIANPEDPVDAIFSAAHYLQAAGAGSDLGRSIFAYNHSNRYVDQVVQQAIVLGSIPADLLTTLTEKGRGEAAAAIQRATGSKGLLDPGASVNSVGRAMLLDYKPLLTHILKDPNISVYGCGREDIAAGIVDRRVLETLQYLAANDLRPTVSSLRCGHGYFTKSGNVSEHSSGDAVDISAINGTSILGHQGPGSITETTITQLLRLGGGMKPHQIISLMTFQGADNTFSMGDHANHIHIGFAAKRGIIGL